MLYGIISDIHANLEAFETVLRHLKGSQQIICLGDVIGYGPDPNECLDLIKKYNILTVCGNHERSIVDHQLQRWFNKNAQAAIGWAEAQLTVENRSFIELMPQIIEQDDFHCVHGSLRDPASEYVTSIAEAQPTFAKMTKPLCFVGHSHKPLFIAKKTDGNYDGRELKDDDEVLIDNYEQVIINVGAVGQPRDGDPRASFGVYNTKTKLFSLHRVEYDIKAVQSKMKRAKLPSSLIERLEFGR